MNVALFKGTAFRVSSCHHQVSFSVYVPFPDVSTLLLRFSEESGILLANLDSSCSNYSSFIFV